MNKKLYTFLFILISTLINIVATLVIIIGLCTIDVVLMRKVIKIPAESTAFGSSLMVCFVLGIALSFFFYTKISTKIIQKFRMDQKFEDKWLDHSRPHQRKSRKAKEEESSEVYESQPEEEVKPRKTKLPSSVLPTDEEKEEAERWGEE